MNSSKSKVVHHLPGRIRIFAPNLKGKQKKCNYIVQKLTETIGINKVSANPLTGRVLIIYNEQQLNQNNLVNLVSEVIIRNKIFPLRNIEEPEDLAIRKQVFNVVLGGCMLAYLSAKHLLFGRTTLAKNPYLFGLNATIALVSGYPILRSSFQSLAKGRVNHDVLISTLALSTIVVRESIPGLLVILLSNLTSLGQSLVLNYYRQIFSKSILLNNVNEQNQNIFWGEAGQQYAHRILLPVLVISLLLITNKGNGFQKTLAMLLAANPSPVGLAAPTAATAVMATGAKNGILYHDMHTVEKISQADTIIFDGINALPNTLYQFRQINSLRSLGISNICLILKEKSYIVEQYIKKQGVHQIWSNLSYSQMTNKINELQQQGHSVVMVIGGSDNSELPAAADTSIGYIDNRHKALPDVILKKQQLAKAFRLSIMGKQKSVQNVLITQAANVLGLSLAASGQLAPTGAAVYNNLTSLALGLNSLRILF